jgi:ankyrin repeat protein
MSRSDKVVKATGFRKMALAPLFLAFLAGCLCISGPAHAQFTQAYKFLEAVKKKEGQKVEDAINEPGSTVVNARDVTTGDTALHIVVQRRDLTWLRYLVGKGADVNIRNDRGITPIQLATSLGWLDGVEYLVAKDADVDQSNDTGETPLISAVHRRDLALMRVLLKGGADPDRADNSGRTARDYARLDGDNSQLLAAIEANAKPRDKAKAKGVYGPTL